MPGKKVDQKSRRREKRHHPLVSSFVRNLTRLRDERGLSKTALATDAGVNVSHLGRIERFGAAPSLDIVARLAHALDVPVATLIAPDDEKAESDEPLRERIRESLEQTLVLATKPQLHALAIVISAVGRAQS